MAKSGITNYTALSDKEATQFLSNESILPTGQILYVTGRGEDEKEVYIGIGKQLSDTPGFNRATIQKLADLQFAFDNLTLPISAIINLQAALDSKAPLIHTHTIAQVDGLQAALDGKAALIHTHPISQVINLQATIDALVAVDVDLQNQINAVSYEPGTTAVDEGTF